MKKRRVNGKAQRWVVLPDIHVGKHDVSALGCAYKAIQTVKPYGVVCLGDFGECESVSVFQWKHKKKPEFEYLRPVIDKEVDMINTHLDKYDKVLKGAGVKRKVFLQGNHEERFDRMVERDPVLKDLRHNHGIGYDWRCLSQMDGRKFEYYPLGEMLMLGKLRLYHGHFYGGVHHTKSHLQKMGVSVMYGHWHDVQQYSVTHEDGAKSAWSIGCLKSLHPDDNEWLGRRPVNWSHAFAVVDVFENGNFSVHVHWIINGTCVVDGAVVRG